MTLNVVAYAVRRVPVRVDVSAVELGEDYRIDEDNIRIESLGHPDDVVENLLTVSGPADVVDYIEEAVIVLDAAEATASFMQETYITEFLNADGATVGEGDLAFAEVVMVYVPVHFVKNVPLGVRMIDGGGIRQIDVESSVISPATIRLQGDRELLDGIHTIDLGVIDLAELDSMSVEFPFDVMIPVNGVVNVDRIEYATVSITIAGVSERDLVVENIRVSHTPAGLTYRVARSSVSVRLRGPTASVQSLSADDITVMIDLSEQDEPVTAGRLDARATVNIRGAPLVVAIGELRVPMDIGDS